ncbi:hypothetical protein KGO06_01355 [Patescibacteria group bacterium]|nr:hypothetical protein [Patescibacteria group bacterium]
MDREIRGLHEAAYLLAAFSLVSQVLALLRDRTFAHLFGAGPELDIYFAAFRVPDVAFAVFTLVVSSFVLVPLFSRRSPSERLGALRSLVFYFGVAAVPIALVLMLSLDLLVPLLAPGFSAAALEETASLARILLIQPILLGISSILASYVQSERRFALFALAPALYNLGIIAGAMFLFPTFGMAGLAWGVVLGAALHLGVQIGPVMRGQGASGGLSVSEFTHSVITPSVPRSLTLFSTQLLLVAFAALASQIAVGSVAALSFAFNLQSVALTVIGLSYASALFPALAGHAHRAEWGEYAREVWVAVRHLVFWLLPATMLIIVLRAHIVRVVLGSGAFSWDDTRLTAAMLALFVVSLLAQALLLAFSRAYYAAHASLAPVCIAFASALGAAGLAFLSIHVVGAYPVMLYFLEALLRVSDVPGTEVLVLPAAFSAAMILAALVYVGLFVIRYGGSSVAARAFGTSFAASVAGAAAAYLALNAFGPLLPTNTFLGIFAQGVTAGAAGLVLWIAVLVLLKSAELRDITALVTARFLR